MSKVYARVITRYGNSRGMGDVDGVRCRRTGLGALCPRLWWLWDTPPVALCRFRRIRLAGWSSTRPFDVVRTPYARAG
jgi:hypothetical protein